MEKREFPLRFNKCPVCGCEETVCGSVEATERANGRFQSDFHPTLAVETVAIFDPTLAQQLLVPRRVPALVAYLDACARCGCVYCRKVELGQGEVTPAPKRPMPGGLGFGKG